MAEKIQQRNTVALSVPVGLGEWGVSELSGEDMGKTVGFIQVGVLPDCQEKKRLTGSWCWR